MNRTIQSLLISIFFLVMMVLLFRDHVMPSLTRGRGVEVDRRVLADSWSNQNDWMEIRIGDQRLGAMHSTAEENDSKTGFVMTTNLRVDGGLIRGRLISSSRLNKRLELEAIRLRVQLAGFAGRVMSAEELDSEELPRGAFELVGIVEGTTARFRVKRDDSQQFFEQHLARPVTLSDSITPVLRGQMLNQNVDYAIDVYDPFLGNSASSVIVTYLRDEMENVGGELQTVKKVQIRYQSSRIFLAVDGNGNILRREIPLLAPGTAGAKADDAAKVPTLVLERVASGDARSRWPDLAYTPRPAAIAPEDVRGENKGQLLQGFSLTSLLSQGAKK
ncbi:MAG TPA: hypothetical protein PK988_05400 [Candidatus Sumerlaeota bacterium]|nr:hypothetical protein [Candidatus Sumerlaeota bacterium]